MRLLKMILSTMVLSKLSSLFLYFEGLVFGCGFKNSQYHRYTYILILYNKRLNQGVFCRYA